jgi:hypothetical protein
MVRGQSQAVRDDVAGDVAQPQVVRVSIGPLPPESVGDADAELLGQHAGG